MLRPVSSGLDVIPTAVGNIIPNLPTILHILAASQGMEYLMGFRRGLFCTQA